MRTTINLNGFWHFLPELDPRYHADADYALPNWDRRHWDIVRVPGCWNKYAERYSLFEGVAWFARTFRLPAWPVDAIGVLRFGAINYEAEIYVNGAKAGEHRGGYTEFTVDASRLLHAGENTLAVRVDDRRDRVLLPACFGWYNYGGIHRDVTLEITPGARLDWVGVDAIPAGAGAAGNLRLRLVQREDRPLSCVAAVRDTAGEVAWHETFSIGGPAGEVTVPWRLTTAQPWSPATPALYEMAVTLVGPDGATTDHLCVPFGVREIRTEGRELLLNGEPVWLKGICYMEDHPAVGISYDAEVARNDLDDMQALGINALRCHLPLHEAMLRECDRRGLMVLSEVPVYCLDPVEPSGSAFADAAYIDLATGMEREMVLAAYSHPSVIMWSLGNECKVAHPEAFGFFQALAATVRGLDSTRLLVYASLYGDVGPVAELVDVIGVNEYWGWYDRVDARPGGDRPLLEGTTVNPDGSRTLQVGALDLSRLQREVLEKAQRYDKPLVFTEFGADAIPGYRSADLALWSEDYQAHFLTESLRAIAGAPNTSGSFPFDYQDYPDPSKYVNARWAGINLKGVVTYNRVRKAGFAALREAYLAGEHR